LAIFDTDHIPVLTLQPQKRIMNRVAIHPGSGSETKNWPEEKWAGFLEHLTRRTDYQLLLIGGEAEGERLGRLAAKLPPDRVHLAQSLPLVELAKLIQSCALFVGHDSGISHLAAALGLPGIVLWAHTAEEIWRPPNEKIVVLRNPRSLAELEVKTVVEAFDQVSSGVSSRLNPGFAPEENERKI
jgi:heptosyltransferase-2